MDGRLISFGVVAGLMSLYALFDGFTDHRRKFFRDKALRDLRAQGKLIDADHKVTKGPDHSAGT